MEGLEEVILGGVEVDFLSLFFESNFLVVL